MSEAFDRTDGAKSARGPDHQRRIELNVPLGVRKSSGSYVVITQVVLTET